MKAHVPTADGELCRLCRWVCNDLQRRRPFEASALYWNGSEYRRALC